MVTSELTAYIHQQLGAGIAEDIIRKNLSALGWSEQDVSDAFSGIGGAQREQPATPQPLISPLPAQMPVQTRIPAQDPVRIPPTQAPIQTAPSQPSARNLLQDTATPAGPKNHKAAWIVAVALFVIVAAGGAFAAYYFGAFASPTPALVTPVAPPTVSTTPAPPIPAASSTPQAPVNMGSSTAASLSAGSAVLPTATLTVNNATSAIASASAFTLKWSSANAGAFSATQSVSGCVIPALNMPDTALKGISSAHGTNSSLVFTKNDLVLLAGCSINITYTAVDATTTAQAQSAVTITFPSDATTTQALINMTSLRAK